ncbi:hypothetical protein F5887DRAFT_1167534 [Amanita rubescens]|nr:hypothetical protein F5887DRAFT_1167534 [Amanita rubescens]
MTLSARDDVTGATCNPTTSLPLPGDLLEEIFMHLDAQDLRKCLPVSKQINNFIHSSVILRYRLACHAAGVVDNTYCTLSFAARYEALMKREKAWCRFQPAFIKTFDDVHNRYPVWDLTSGVYLYYFHVSVHIYHLHYCLLPSTPDDVLRWTAIPNHTPIVELTWNRPRADIIREAGMAIDEHDLMVTSSRASTHVDQEGTMPRCSIYMTLLQFSTGEYHPLAHCPRIDIQDNYELNQIIKLEIAGDNLALLVGTRGGDQLYIFDWKTGHKRLKHRTWERAYFFLAFVSPEILLIPNDIRGQHEVWEIPKEADSVPYQVLSLRFPALSKEYSISGFYCSGRPGPHNVLRTSPKPFHTSVDETTIMIRVVISTALSPNQTNRTFVLFIRRRSLLETITNLRRTGVPPPFNVLAHSNNEVVMYDDSGMPYSFSTITDFEAPSGKVYTVKSIPWSEWGPPISRWLDVGGKARTWYTSSAGQRWMRLEPVDDDENGERCRLSIVDFNPYNVCNPQDNLPGELVVGRKGDYFDHGNVFAEVIEMGLGCTIYTAPEVYDYNRWFMDDERVLGFKYDWDSEHGGVEEITVFHFG